MHLGRRLVCEQPRRLGFDLGISRHTDDRGVEVQTTTGIRDLQAGVADRDPGREVELVTWIVLGRIILTPHPNRPDRILGIVLITAIPVRQTAPESCAGYRAGPNRGYHPHGGMHIQQHSGQQFSSTARGFRRGDVVKAIRWFVPGTHVLHADLHPGDGLDMDPRIGTTKTKHTLGNRLGQSVGSTIHRRLDIDLRGLHEPLQIDQHFLLGSDLGIHP